MNKCARTRGQSKLIDHVLEVLGIKKSPVKREGEREKSRGVSWVDRRNGMWDDGDGERGMTWW